jgi:cardiolipin synthase
MTHRKLAACAAVAALAGGGCSALHHDQRSSYTLHSPLAVDDAAFPRSLDTFGSVMLPGNEAELIENGAVLTAMLEEIRRARRSVNLEIYIFKSDEVGRLFADAMIEASRRGVEVRLMVDAQGSKLDHLRDELEAANVRCHDYRPGADYNYLGRRTHRKLLIVDGTIGYTGGFCLDRRWLGDARSKEEWHDSAVRVTGPVVAQMQAIFGEDWTFTTGEILAGETFYPQLDAAGSKLAHAIKASKGDPSSVPKMLYYLAIQAARRTLHIENPYFLPDAQIRKALVDAARRGVDVRIVLPGKHMDIPMIRMASRADFGSLLQGGVRIYEYQPTMIHSKVLVVDGLFVTIGSINFDARSMSKNAEESVSLYDRAFAAAVEAMFQRDLAQSREITYAAWKDRGASARLAETFSSWFKPLY